MDKTKPAAAGGADGRVSPTAPASMSASVQAWDDATSDPNFTKAVKAGLADLKAGRTRPWSEIRRRTK